jgi:Tfp pilus assembly protein PilV
MLVNRRSLKEAAGDTIVEVLIATAILGIVLTGAYVTANRSYLTIFSAQQRQEALSLAQSQLEELSSVPTATLPSRVVTDGNGQPFCLSTANPAAIITNTNDCLMNNIFTVQINKTNTAAALTPIYKIIVSWESAVTGNTSSPQPVTDNVTLYYQPGEVT